jgi:hypothetical protein
MYILRRIGLRQCRLAKRSSSAERDGSFAKLTAGYLPGEIRHGRSPKWRA